MTARTPIDPALRRYLDALQANAPPPPANEADRVAMVRAGTVRALESRESIEGLPNEVASEDLRIAGTLPARLYRPAQRSSNLMVYFHGGGWVTGSVASHDPFCRLLAEAAGVAILSVEYRLAPEHPFPAPLDDAIAAVEWAARHAEELGFDGLLVGGDSAGANLAAAAANRLADRISLRAQMLLYPVTDHPSGGHASYEENATGCGLEAAAMHWFWDQYLAGAEPGNPDISPLRRKTLPALPPTLVTSAGYDVLRDEAIAYADKLRQAGVTVTRIHTADMQHNFPTSPGTVMRFPQSKAALGGIAAWLKATLA